MNELLFLLHTCVISSTALLCLRHGESALVGFISLQSVLANLFVIKQIHLFGLAATCADPFTVGAVFGLNLLQEYHGKKVARKAIWTSFLLLVFYAIACQIHLMYLPSISDTMQHHFMPLLSPMPRIVVASFTVYLIVQHLDSFIYDVLYNYFNGKHLVLRNYTSILFCQFIDTVGFSFLGLYGLVDNILSIILVSYTIKVMTIFLATPFIKLSKLISPRA